MDPLIWGGSEMMFEQMNLHHWFRSGTVDTQGATTGILEYIPELTIL